MSRIPVALQKRVRLGFALCALGSGCASEPDGLSDDLPVFLLQHTRGRTA